MKLGKQHLSFGLHAMEVVSLETGNRKCGGRGTLVYCCVNVTGSTYNKLLIDTFRNVKYLSSIKTVILSQSTTFSKVCIRNSNNHSNYTLILETR